MNKVKSIGGIPLDAVPLPETASVGQYIAVAAVDENGNVTATEAVTPAAGSMFSTAAVGILPTVYNGTATSEFTLNFESSAVGAVGE